MKNILIAAFLLISLNAFSQGNDEKLKAQISEMQEGFRKFSNQSAVGTTLFFVGIGGGVAATFAVEDENSKEITYAVSGGLVLVGLLVQMTAYKHIRSASNASRFEFNNGICYNF